MAQLDHRGMPIPEPRPTPTTCPDRAWHTDDRAGCRECGWSSRCQCGSRGFELNRYCGAWVCYDCGHHHGLASCYCGWSASGGNGYQELIEAGERIEPEDY